MSEQGTPDDEGSAGQKESASAGAQWHKNQSETVSNLFRRIISEENGGTISVGEIAAALQDRAFGPCLLFFSLPGCMPGFPIMTSIFGPPMAFFGWQIMAGMHRPWLPDFVSNKTLKRETIGRFIDKAERYVVWFETLCRPRWEAMLENWVERLMGALVVLFSICVIIPLPGTNLIPCIAISIMALGFMQRDGVVVLLGAIIGLIGAILTYFIIAASIGFVVKHI